VFSLTEGFEGGGEASVYGEVLVVDECAEGESFEEIDESFVYFRVVFFFAWGGSGVHYSLKLKKEVIVRP
jgi:hypothetical protein